jgi:hypothetical protein
MYILLPLCWLIAKREFRDVPSLVAVSFILALIVGGHLAAVVPGLWWLSVFTFGPCFVAGVLAYHILR